MCYIKTDGAEFGLKEQTTPFRQGEQNIDNHVCYTNKLEFSKSQCLI